MAITQTSAEQKSPAECQAGVDLTQQIRDITGPSFGRLIAGIRPGYGKSVRLFYLQGECIQLLHDTEAAASGVISQSALWMTG